MVLQFAAGTVIPSKQQQRLSDMNGDGKVTAIDARQILTLCIDS
jgi:hypothetical protein